MIESMVDVAQLVERGIVIPVVVGSIPIVHPISRMMPSAGAAAVDKRIGGPRLRGFILSGR